MRSDIMQIRLGYVATALKLGKVTSSSTVTYSTYTKQSTDRDKLEKLQKMMKQKQPHPFQKLVVLFVVVLEPS